MYDSSRRDELWYDELHEIGGDGETYAAGGRIKQWRDDSQCGNTDQFAL